MFLLFVFYSLTHVFSVRRQAYYHELFIRGRPDLCQLMQRTRVKGSWVRQSSSPETEPNFAIMPEVPKVPPRPISKLPPLRNNAGSFKKTASQKVEMTPSATKIPISSRSSRLPVQSLSYLQQKMPVSFPSSIQEMDWTSSQSVSLDIGPQLQQVRSQMPMASFQAPQSSIMADDLTPLPFQHDIFDPPAEPVTLASFLLDVGFDTDNEENDDEEDDIEPLPWNIPSNLSVHHVTEI